MEVTTQEAQCIARLRACPELYEPLEALVNLANNAEAPLSADEAEERLIDLVQQLGRKTLSRWASQREVQLVEQARTGGQRMQQREKKRLHWWSTFGRIEVVERIWRSPEHCYWRVLPEAIGVLKELAPLREAANVAEEEAPVRRAWRYLSNRPDQLFYDEAIREPLPIGSGIIESGHKHVLQSRLKKSGIAWLPQSAETIAQARTVIANEHWEHCWESSLTA